eukprot:TRINITY_DN1492_c2_g1_i1.p1 TRINITY_DN1492_c2_g1~~TRINITY_DN1492_c2_g1_i1.p1  ORF type:complete len:179 (+),score=33.15 TRINITY_DN1492_c2_g1_i1:147-683(+)
MTTTTMTMKATGLLGLMLCCTIVAHFAESVAPPREGCFMFGMNLGTYHFKHNYTDSAGNVYYTGYGYLQCNTEPNTLVYGSTDANRQFSSFTLFFPSDLSYSNMPNIAFSIAWQGDRLNGRAMGIATDELNDMALITPGPVEIAKCDCSVTKGLDAETLQAIKRNYGFRPSDLKLTRD